MSNRWELGGAEVLRWHWAKAGTIEHVHDVTKNELGAAVLPCGRFGAHAAWYRLSPLTYNILSAMKSLVLPAPLSAARPKRLRFALFTIAGRLISHADQLVLRISAAAEQLPGLGEARRRLATHTPSSRACPLAHCAVITGALQSIRVCLEPRNAICAGGLVPTHVCSAPTPEGDSVPRRHTGDHKDGVSELCRLSRRRLVAS